MTEPKFMTPAHRRAYLTHLNRCKAMDSYHRALIYILTAVPALRNNIDACFNFEKDEIKPESLAAGWQTNGTTKLTRFAYNLWNGYDDKSCTPYDLFDCSFAPYMYEAVKLRYACFNDQSKEWAGYLNSIVEQPQIGGIFYNKDVFDACGITETPKTWDEFLTVCQTIKDNGYEPLALDGAYANFNFYNHLVRHLGEDAIAELGKNGGWADNEAAVTAAQEIIDFVNAGYLAEGAPDAYPASQTKVGLGTAAMVVCANYVTSEVDAAVGEPVNWGFFNYPEVEGNVDASAYAGANSLAISSNCENPQAAFDFIMTIVTGTCGQELVDKGGQIPADTRLKESVLAGSVETLKNTTTPMSWCGSLNTLDGWSSIKSSMIELFEGKYATGADYCAYLDTLCG